MDKCQGLPDVAILANPIAGSESSAGLLEKLVQALIVAGLRPVVCRRPQDLPVLASAVEKPLRCIIAAGGDGTLAEVLNQAPGTPVCVFPLGNENLVARHFGYDKSIPLLTQTVLAARPRSLDLGRMNGRYFTLMAGAGFDAEVVHRVHEQRRGHVNKASYALAILRALRDYNFPPIDLEIEESGERLRGALVLAFNLPVYALGLPLASQANPCDGLLDLFVFQRPGVRNLLRYIYASSRGRQQSLMDVQHRLVKRVHLRSERGVPAQMDGDPAGFLPATIQAVAGTWPLLAPLASQSTQNAL